MRKNLRIVTIEIIDRYQRNQVAVQRAVIGVLAVAEILIGIGLISGKLPRITAIVALGHMAGIFLTVFILPGEIWVAWGAPTLNGQYVMKNAVLPCALLNVALRVFRKAPEKAVVHREAGLVDQLGQHVRR
jgi:uncharacterized membrane protein YphA (DoxX/SURF4 family)